MRPIIVINKVDKPNCRPEEVYEVVFDPMCGLNTTEDQLNFPTVYGSAKNSWTNEDWRKPTDNIEYLLDLVIEAILAPEQIKGTPQMLITSLDYSGYIGRIAVGRVHRGTLKDGQNITIHHHDGIQERTETKEPHTFEGMEYKKTDAVDSGDICAVTGLEKFEIGNTIADLENPEPLPPIAVDEPTISILFATSDSPFFGKEGKFCTSRHISDHLNKEPEKSLAPYVRPMEDSMDKWIVSDRGALHLSVLTETTRHEGYELQVGQSQIIYKEIDNQRYESIEELTTNVPIDFSSKMISMVIRRRGDLLGMGAEGEHVSIAFKIPSHGIIGLHTNVLIAGQGEAIMVHRFKDYQPFKGKIVRRTNGSMIALEAGTAYAYVIDRLQDRGKFFADSGEEIYGGQVAGEHVYDNDLATNITRVEQLTDVHTSGSDEKARVIPKTEMSLEECLEYIKGNEHVEVTPKNVRMREVTLGHNDRKRESKE